jgi:uncharacterized membrane protein YraQ (UPF0718 family)
MSTTSSPPALFSRRKLTASVVLGLVVLGFVCVPKLMLEGSVNDFFMLTFSVIIESVPFLILGSFLAAVVRIYVPLTWFIKVLPKHSHLRRFVLSFFGVLLPVCECGNIPMARGLMLKGFTVPEATVFLLAAPIVNPVTIITTHQAFGWDGSILIWRVVGGLLIANFIGWLFAQHPEPEKLLAPSFEHACRVDSGQVQSKKVSNLANLTTHELLFLLPTLIIGAVVAALVQVLVPREVLVAVGNDFFLSVLVMLLLAVIIAICSNVDSFFALSFASTFTNGSLITFLLAGPLIDVKMIALMRTTFTTQAVTIIVVAVASIAVLVGLGVNFVG